MPSQTSHKLRRKEYIFSVNQLYMVCEVIGMCILLLLIMICVQVLFNKVSFASRLSLQPYCGWLRILSTPCTQPSPFSFLAIILDTNPSSSEPRSWVRTLQLSVVRQPLYFCGSSDFVICSFPFRTLLYTLKILDCLDSYWA